MKKDKKITNTSLDGELFKMFNESLDYTPEQMKAAIAEANRALDFIEEEETELDELLSFREDYNTLMEEFN